MTEPRAWITLLTLMPAFGACRPGEVDPPPTGADSETDATQPPDDSPTPVTEVNVRPIGRSSAAPLVDVQTVGFRQADGGVQAGESVALGDFDGDLRADLFVGASAWDGPWVSQGAGWGFAATVPDTLCDVDPVGGGRVCSLESGSVHSSVNLTGPPLDGAVFATALATGDLDDDGFEDLIVGSPGASSVMIWYGVPGMAWTNAAPDVLLHGLEGLGAAVAFAGDINRDGCGDLAVGANKTDSNRGAALVLYTPGGGQCERFPVDLDLAQPGTFDVRLRGVEPDDFVGTSVASAGDVDGDGADDLLVGVPKSIKSTSAKTPGDVWLLYGGTEPRELGSCEAGCDIDLDPLGTTANVDGVRYTLDPSLADQWLGNKVVGVGDVTGDGCEDVLLAAMKYSGAGTSLSGAAFLADGSGPCDGGVRRVSEEVILDGSGDDYVARFVGVSVDDKLGEAIASVGDVDGDGIADFLLGAYRDDEQGGAEQSNSGAAFLVYGGWSGFDEVAPPTIVPGTHICDAGGLWAPNVPPYLMIYGTAEREAFGKHVAGGGDVNGDGLDDFIVGAPRWGSSDNTCSSPECDKGNAFLFYGDVTQGCLDQ